MIIIRAPLRVSFVGGGTDIKQFYSRYPGRVLSAGINKFVYIVLNEAEFLNEFIMKYRVTEVVKHPKDLDHGLFREALLDLNLTSKGLEMASFMDFPANSGLGASSSFSVALIKALHTYIGKPISKAQAAEAACRLEIDLVKSPIGKQDQYAAAFGGINMFTFNADGGVDAEPVFLDFKTKADLEDHLVMFFTGLTRSTNALLSGQTADMEQKFEIYKKMSDSVLNFRDVLMAGDLRTLAKLMHQAWLDKKSLSVGISNPDIDALYDTALGNGAWGGKLLGAGGGGCFLFLAPPDKHAALALSLSVQAKKLGLDNFQRVPFAFSQSGVDVIFNS